MNKKVVILIIVVGLVLSSCGGGGGENEQVQPTPEASNPTKVRGSGNLGMDVPSVSNAYFDAVLYEYGPGQVKDDAIAVDTATEEEVNHTEKCSPHCDPRLPAPNFSADNTYFVDGKVYQDLSKQNILLEGKCKDDVDAPVRELCTVMGEGKLKNFYMDLVPVDLVQ